MEIKLYSTNCPKCKVLESKLKQKGVEFEIITDSQEVVKVGKENRIMAAPILKVDDKVMDFSAANAWINSSEADIAVEDCKACELK